MHHLYGGPWEAFSYFMLFSHTRLLDRVIFQWRQLLIKRNPTLYCRERREKNNRNFFLVTNCYISVQLETIEERVNNNCKFFSALVIDMSFVVLIILVLIDAPKVITLVV